MDQGVAADAAEQGARLALKGCCSPTPHRAAQDPSPRPLPVGQQGGEAATAAAAARTANPPLGYRSDLGAIAWRHRHMPGDGPEWAVTPSAPAAPREVCPARRRPPTSPGADAVGTGAKPVTAAGGRPPHAPPHRAHYVAWPGSAQRSIETYFHGKIRSIFGFRVAEIAQAPTVMQLPICSSFPGGRAAVGLPPRLQAPPAGGSSGAQWDRGRQCCSPAATVLRRRQNSEWGTSGGTVRGP